MLKAVIVKSGSFQTRPHVLHQLLMRLDAEIGFPVKLVVGLMLAVAKFRVLGWLVRCIGWHVGMFSNGGSKIDDAVRRLK